LENSATPFEPAVSFSLQRHAERRQQGIPTVTYLAGPSGLGSHAFATWVASVGRSYVRCDVPDATQFLHTWLTEILQRYDVPLLVAEAAAPLLREAPGPLLQRLRQGATLEHSLLWARIGEHDPALASFGALLVRTEPTEPRELAELLVQALAGKSPWTLLRLVCPLIPRHTAPALLLVHSAADGSDGLLQLARLASRLVEEWPEFCVALASDASLEPLAECRDKTLLREGHVQVRSLDPSGIKTLLSQRGAQLPEATVARLAKDGVDRELLELCTQAARGARSEAERFLFARLQSLPWALGHFKLNGMPGFTFGGKQAEVDLLAQELRIAVEIDGYYHFQGQDTYRRDRRKDFELQHRGYLVLRFLEQDIVARLEEILSQLHAAVLWRQEQRLKANNRGGEP
jgi:very-short-patch-repair endonuclease